MRLVRMGNAGWVDADRVVAVVPGFEPATGRRLEGATVLLHGSTTNLTFDDVTPDQVAKMLSEGS